MTPSTKATREAEVFGSLLGKKNRDAPVCRWWAEKLFPDNLAPAPASPGNPAQGISLSGTLNKMAKVTASPILHSQGVPDHLRRSRAWRSALRVSRLLENFEGCFSAVTGLA